MLEILKANMEKTLKLLLKTNVEILNISSWFLFKILLQGFILLFLLSN